MQIPRLALCTKDTARHDHEKGTEGFMPDIGTDGLFDWLPGAQNHGIPDKYHLEDGSLEEVVYILGMAPSQ